jgi:predicted O-methyltransferase YrrM
MIRSRALREQLKFVLHRLFVLGQRLGVDILPRHFYSSIPDIQALRRSEYWRRPLSMAGVSGAETEPQMAFLESCCPSPLRERLKQTGIYERACNENGAVGYGPAEAEFLYCFIATKRPLKIVQIGCGVSTSLILSAAKESGYKPRITCIDPYPTVYLKRAAEQKQIELVSVPAEEVDLDLVTSVGAGDLLFIDSTHAVRPGSEVNRVILEALPRMKPGSTVHFHDIYFPFDYQSTLLTTLFFAAESSLLHAFLINNRQYKIAVSLSMLHHACPQRLQSVLPHYRPSTMIHGLHTSERHPGHFPSATYLSVL